MEEALDLSSDRLLNNNNMQFMVSAVTEPKPLSVPNSLLHLTVQNAVQIMDVARATHGCRCARCSLWSTAWLVICI